MKKILELRMKKNLTKNIEFSVQGKCQLRGVLVLVASVVSNSLLPHEL